MNRIVLGTLRQRWLRTLIVGLSTLVAFMLLGFFLALRHGFAVGPAQVGADLLLLEPARGSSPLPIGLLSIVRSFPAVRAAAAIDGTGMRFGAHRHPVGVEGLSPKAFLEISGLVGSKALPRRQARNWLADPTGALVSADAARKYGWHVGQTVVLHAMPGTPPRRITFRIDGVIARRNGVKLSSDVNLHLGYFRRWAHVDSVDFMFLQVARARQADAVAQAIERRFANSTTPVTTQSFKSLLQGIAERLANVNAITFVVIVASLFGLFLIYFNTLIHSVSERVAQFALLKALGFAPGRLVWLVFLEALVSIIPAAGAGTLCAWLLVQWIAGAKLHLPGIRLTSEGLAASGLIALGLAMLCSVVPGLQVVRLNCGRALRKG